MADLTRYGFDLDGLHLIAPHPNGHLVMYDDAVAAIQADRERIRTGTIAARRYDIGPDVALITARMVQRDNGAYIDVLDVLAVIDGGSDD